MINVECMNPIEDVYNAGESTILDFAEIPVFDEDIYDFNDDKSFKKFMADLENIVRNSFEYRQLMAYLRNTENFNRCSVLNVVSEPGSKVRIEIHHSPLTLYDICLTVFKKRMDKHESVRICDIAEEVLYLHYIGWVGLIPLSATVHESVHNGYTFIPTDVIRGNYRAFVNSYYDYISPETLDAIDNAEQATQDNLYDKRKEIFNDHKIYVNVDGSYTLPRKDETRRLIRDHITELKTAKIQPNGPEGKVMCRIVHDPKVQH